MDMSERRHLKVPLHILAAGGSTLLLVLVAVILAWNAYRSTRQVVSSAVNESIQHVSMALKDKIRGILKPAQNQLELLAFHRVTQASSLAERLAAVPMAHAVFATNPLLDAWYVAYANGDFLLFRPLHDAQIRRIARAPEGASLLVQTQTVTAGGLRLGEYRFYDEYNRLLALSPRPDYQFDPRQRAWYEGAQQARGASVSAPYTFFTRQAVGTTLSRRADQGDAVVGLDATLTELVREIDDLKITPGSRVAIVDASNHVVAMQPLERAVKINDHAQPQMARIDEVGVAPLAAAALLPVSGVQRQQRTLAGADWELISVSLAEQVEGHALRVLMAVPHEELFKDARGLLNRQLYITLLLVLFSVPGGFWLTQQIVRPLKILADEAHAVASFEFGPGRLHRSRIAEVDLLATATMQMRATISRFLEVSAALSSETRLERLLEIVLTDVASTARARSGALYLYDDESRQLTRSQLRGGKDDEARYPELLHRDRDAMHPAVRAAGAHGKLVADEVGGHPEMVAVSLETLDKQFVGALVLELPRPLKGGRSGRRDPLRAFIEALSSTAAVAIETRHLVDSQKALLEGLVQLLAGAIDAKSRYTGGHCQRVPELTRMLAQAAHQVEHGPFKDFHLNEEDWEAVHVGAWLHDCGKVTTPEYVVDKATKLETIYNRIHEVRMRFEVLKRDAEIAFLRQSAPAGAAQHELHDIWARLDEEFAFVASCNVGSESLDPERIARLAQIAQRTWQRTLDNRLGLSRDEQRALGSEPAAELPVSERVLMDRPEHIVERPASELIPEDNRWGFHLQVPQHKFNRGELHNLSVSRGTLTEEERYIINEHIVQTIMMLGQLPFPRHLRSVPEIAGGHHERMDGRGYPKGLVRAQMSIPARIMAIADVFEALTAADRPYKAAKTLSESLAIMARMVSDRHLDAELFELFVQSGVYRQYADCYLQPEQIDSVDEAALLNAARMAS